MITRRQAAIGLPSLMTASIAFDVAGALDVGRLRLSSAEQLEAFVKLKADLSGEPIGIHYQADVFLFRSNRMMPVLLRCEGYSWNSITKGSDGSYEAKLHEVGFYLNPKTGDVQTEMILPTTNRSHAVEPHFTSKSSYILSPDTIKVPAFADRTDVRLDLQVRPPVSIDDTLIVHEDLQSEFIPTKTGRIERDDGSEVAEGAEPRRVSQLTSFSGDLGLALDPNVTYVPAGSSSMMFSDTGIFIFDLEKPLPVVWRLFGRKVRTHTNVSSGFRSLVDREYPKFWTSPEL